MGFQWMGLIWFRICFPFFFLPTPKEEAEAKEEEAKEERDRQKLTA